MKVKRSSVPDHKVTSDIAEHISGTTYSDLPSVVVDKARVCLLDSIGCMIGGSRIPEARRSVDIITALGQLDEAHVPGLEGTFPAPFAAYADAQFANALDYDDTVLGVGHPGAAVLATALSIGEQRAASGEQLITAIVAGYEAAIRIGRGIRPSEHRAHSVRGHSWTIFGAVAAAASLLDLSSEQCRYAFGFAAQHAPVPFVGKWYERPITDIKNNYGWAAMGGIIAARLAEGGAFGNRDVLDGANGFWAMASSDHWDVDKVLEDLGEHWAILDVGFKPYACCRYTHTALDALTSILSENHVAPPGIHCVTVRTASRARIFADYQPRSLLDAQFSLPFAIASVLLDRQLTVDNTYDPQVIALADKVKIEVDPDDERRASLSGFSSTVEILLADGKTFVAHSDVLPGTPERPLSLNDLESKFLGLSVPVIGPERARRLCDLIQGPEAAMSATALAENYSLSEHGVDENELEGTGNTIL